MRKSEKGRSIDTIFVLIVFSIFAVSVLMVLMLGASIYSNINDIALEGQYEQTVLSYIWTKTKNFDDAGSLHVGDFDGNSALFIDEKLGDYYYRTTIYSHDGWLRELFSEVTFTFSPRDGAQVARIDDLRFEEAAHGLIKVTAGSTSLYLYPRSSGSLPFIGGNE